ncbi:MAG: hypothetical protein BWY88_00947 [Synergistetes bacterium ADurb.Bin520]|nr:MAG: hypothetical protein BWY88_00947 [Synergistetes bacterium ADurb.Bin520]
MEPGKAAAGQQVAKFPGLFPVVPVGAPKDGAPGRVLQQIELLPLLPGGDLPDPIEDLHLDTGAASQNTKPSQHFPGRTGVPPGKLEGRPFANSPRCRRLEQFRPGGIQPTPCLHDLPATGNPQGGKQPGKILFYRGDFTQEGYQPRLFGRVERRTQELFLDSEANKPLPGSPAAEDGTGQAFRPGLPCPPEAREPVHNDILSPGLIPHPGGMENPVSPQGFQQEVPGRIAGHGKGGVFPRHILEAHGRKGSIRHRVSRLRPVSRFRASRYRERVLATTSGGNWGAGSEGFHPDCTR